MMILNFFFKYFSFCTSFSMCYMWNFGFFAFFFVIFGFFGFPLFFSSNSKKETKSFNKIFDSMDSGFTPSEVEKSMAGGFHDEMSSSGFPGEDKMVGYMSMNLGGDELSYDISYIINVESFLNFPEISDSDWDSFVFTLTGLGGFKVGCVDLGNGYFACKGVYMKASFFFIVKSEKNEFVFPVGLVGFKSSSLLKLCKFVYCYFVYNFYCLCMGVGVSIPGVPFEISYTKHSGLLPSGMYLDVPAILKIYESEKGVVIWKNLGEKGLSKKQVLFTHSFVSNSGMLCNMHNGTNCNSGEDFLTVSLDCSITPLKQTYVENMGFLGTFEFPEVWTYSYSLHKGSY